HLLLHAVLERVHLCAHFHLLDAAQDGAGRHRQRVRRRRHLPLGLADGRRAGGLVAARRALRLLRRALCVGDDRRGGGMTDNPMTRRAVVASLLAAALPCPPVSAQSYPAKPIKLIVPFPAGGPADLFARALAAGMSTELGQQVVVESRAGAGGLTGV